MSPDDELEETNQPEHNALEAAEAAVLSFDALFRTGSDLLHQGKAAPAVPYLEQAHRLQPENVDAGINLAGAYILSKKFKNAVKVLEPLSETNPDNPKIWTNLGAAYLGNPVLANDEAQQQAIAAFERALALDPVSPSVAYNIGLVYRDRGEVDKAIAWFEKAVKHNPRDQHARAILARLRAQQENES
ncbi:MAG: tetratricopeptide repeat protein [Candidatus Promineifilaceae bacterium]